MIRNKCLRRTTAVGLLPYFLASHGIMNTLYATAGTKRTNHHTTRPSKAASASPNVTKDRSGTPKSTNDRKARIAMIGTKTAVVTMPAMTNILGRDRRTKRMR
jgi:hypothetical protein